MTRRQKIWLTVAGLFTVVNVASAGYAIALGEGPHAGSHVVLFMIGGYITWRLFSKGRTPAPTALPLSEERMEQLQQAVDAVAIEVERIGEVQRFNDKLQAERVNAKV